MWLELLPQPRGQTTLVGGTIRLLDPVRDQVTVRVFGGRDMVVLFDDRARFFRDGAAAAAGDLQIGARVYLDTAMAGSGLFARSVRIVTQSPNGQSNGQLQSYDAASGELVRAMCWPLNRQISGWLQAPPSCATVNPLPLRAAPRLPGQSEIQPVGKRSGYGAGNLYPGRAGRDVRIRGPGFTP